MTTFNVAGQGDFIFTKRAKERYWKNHDREVQRSREYRMTHQTQIKEWRKNYWQRHGEEQNRKKRLKNWASVVDTVINGQRTTFRGLSKRPRPDSCEICGKEKHILHYHHWDHTRPDVGLWVCRFCHIGIANYELGRIQVYLEKKTQIDPVLVKLV